LTNPYTMKEESSIRIQKALYKRKMEQREIDKNERHSKSRNTLLRSKFALVAKLALDISEEINKEYPLGTYKMGVTYSRHKPDITIYIVDVGTYAPHMKLVSLSFTAFLLNTITVRVSSGYKSRINQKILLNASKLVDIIEEYIVRFYAEFLDKY